MLHKSKSILVYPGDTEFVGYVHFGPRKHWDSANSPVDVLAGATKHGIHEIEASAGHNTGSAEVGVGKSTHCHEGIYVDGDSE